MFKNEVEACKTRTELMKVLKKYKREVIRDNSKEVGCFSIWIDDTTRIYQCKRGQRMTLQTWKRVKMEYSGIPTFFG